MMFSSTFFAVAGISATLASLTAAVPTPLPGTTPELLWLARGNKCGGTDGEAVTGKQLALDDFCATFKVDSLASVTLSPIVHTLTGSCLGVLTDDVDVMDSPVGFVDCVTNKPSQSWTSLPSNQLRAGVDGFCIASTPLGKFVLRHCNIGLPTGFSWILMAEPKRPPSILMKNNKFTYKCIGGATQNKKVLRVSTDCSIFQTDAYDRLREVGTGYCIDVFNGAFNGTNAMIGLYACHDGLNQKWTLSMSGRFIKAATSNYCLGINWVTNQVTTVPCSAASVVWENRYTPPTPPTRRLAPYVDSSLTNINVGDAVRLTGLRNVLFGFVVDMDGTVSWNGVQKIDRFAGNPVVDKLVGAARSNGAEIIPVLGGPAGLELARNASLSDYDLVAAYQSLVDYYGFRAFVVDLRDAALSDRAANIRRYNVLNIVLQAYPFLDLIYTLQADTLGISDATLAFIQDGLNSGMVPDVVNLLTTNFTSLETNMGAAVTQSAIATQVQLQSLGLDIDIGITPSIGINNINGTFTVDDVNTVVSFALSNKYVKFLSFLNLNRDNAFSNSIVTSSGIPQNTFEFTNAFAQFVV